MPFHGRDTSRFGFPPERDPFEPFPREVPWDAPISELQWSLEINIFEPYRCTRIGLRYLAAHQGWQLTLRELLPRLKHEGRLPDQVILIKHGGLEFRRAHQTEGTYHVLVGPPPRFRD